MVKAPTPSKDTQSEDSLPAFVELLFPKTEGKNEPLVDDLLIQHADYNEIMEALEELDEFDRSVLGEHLLLILGESRLGKTRLIAEYIAKRMPRRTPNGLIIPVLYAEVPERPTIKSLAAAILRAFGESPGRNETAEDLLDRIVVLARNTQVRVVCLDDLHHFTDQRGKQAQYELTEWLKRLTIQMRVALVISGLERTEAAIRINEQLYNRMDEKLLLRRFNWLNPSDRKQFKTIVKGLYESVSQEFSLPTDQADHKFRWYIASAGRIGIVIKIMRRAIKLARKSKGKGITSGTLHRAWLKSVFNSAKSAPEESPFSDKFLPKEDPQTIEKLMKIGREKPPEPSRVRRKGHRDGSNASKKANVREAFPT